MVTRYIIAVIIMYLELADLLFGISASTPGRTPAQTELCWLFCSQLPWPFISPAAQLLLTCGLSLKRVSYQPISVSREITPTLKTAGACLMVSWWSFFGCLLCSRYKTSPTFLNNIFLNNFFLYSLFN